MFDLTGSSVFACFGFLSPANRGALMTTALVGLRSVFYAASSFAFRSCSFFLRLLRVMCQLESINVGVTRCVALGLSLYMRFQCFRGRNGRLTCCFRPF